jgi:hypothetical protein
MSDNDAPTPEPTVWPYIGVGCLTMVVGFFGGGMIAMLVGKVVDGITGCRPPEGLPVCTWWRYWWSGAFIGLVFLPTVAIYRLRRGRGAPDGKQQSQGG